MRIRIILFIIILFNIALPAQIIHVPADYPSIQSGIDASSNGDTVLVEPGLYSENINFNGKNICVASQFIFTQDPVYILQTIIHPDNYDTSSVKFENGEDSTAILAGFKIYGGYMYQGSGIFCKNASPTLRNLIITGGGPGFWGGYGGGIYLENSQVKLIDLLINENSASSGGGIYMEASAPVMANVTVKYNDALAGGGIAANNSTPVFDSTSRCNIFFNEAQTGKDLYSSLFIDVIVDTFTVCYPGPTHAAPAGNFSFDILNCKIDQVEADLYVSPAGSNENSGLTEDAPLKTISYAFSKILADSLNRHTVHLLEGLYSPSANREFFPVTLPNYIDLIGVSNEDVILDASGSASVISIINMPYALISDMTIRGGDASNGAGGGGIYCFNSNPVLRNLIITDNFATYWANGEYGGGAYFSYSNPLLENIVINDNLATEAGGIAVMEGCHVYMKNVIITGNEAFHGGGVYCWQSFLYFDNSTVADNLVGGGIYLDYGIETNINNSIIWNNEGGQIVNQNGWGVVRYSNIMGGFEGEGNINIDPMFMGSGVHPYTLGEFSPCIDTGIPDTSGLNVPPWDIMGNCRVWDGDGDGNARIDMGAYEFGAMPVGIEESSVGSRQWAVMCYPNPANEFVDFRLSMVDGRWVSLKIFDVNGREIETLIDKPLPPGEHTVHFDTSSLSPGIYLYRTSTIDNRPWTIGKVLIIR